MKLVALQVGALHLFVGDVAAGGIFPPIQPARDLEPLGRCGSGDEFDDYLVVT